MRPFFIVGVQRSGTTLLRSILNAHPDIFVAYECALYRVLGPRHAPTIYDKKEFLDDLFQVDRFHYWNVTREQCESAVTDDFSETILRIAEIAAIRSPKFFGFKNPNGIFHLDYTLKTFPGAKIIHIIRDPRGVLASEKKKVFSRNNAYYDYYHIWQVARRSRAAAKIREKWISSPSYLPVKYSSLLSEFDRTTASILNFLGAVPADLSSYSGDIPDAEMGYHALATQPPDTSRLTAFQSELNTWELAAIEGLCGNLAETTLESNRLVRTAAAVSVVAQKAIRRGNPY